MCDNHKEYPDTYHNSGTNRRRGTALEHGKEHTKDHARWSRRNFLLTTGLFTAGSAFMLGNTRLQALAKSPMFSAISAANNERILVIINLGGGNDGLNMVVPRFNDTYYNLRPTIAIQEGNMFALSPDFGMPNTMTSLQPLWNNGNMAVVHSVAYPAQDYSHFRSTDIWMSGSDSDQYLSTGWVGRFLDQQYPAFETAPANFPVGLQVGNQSSLIFSGGDTQMGLTINNATEFYQIAQTGQLFDVNSINTDCSYGQELLFMRQTANNTVRYAQAIKDAYDNASFFGAYPSNSLAYQLALVARLIKGNLGTRVYMVEIGGFDTHANQNNYHPGLMTQIATAVSAFYNDLTLANRNQDVLTMTFSEFGRTSGENGSLGTDHGQAAPVMIFGGTVQGGLKGQFGEIATVSYADQAFTTDFRSVYATILKDWFCLEPIVVNAIMGREFPLVPGLLPECTPSTGSNDLAVLLGHNPSLTEAGTILIKYAILQRGLVRLQVLNSAGQVKATLLNNTLDPNSYTFPFKASDFGLPPGNYIYRLETGGKRYSRQMRVMS
ncbi:DUF1501 domain-containing protein [Sphingobacteriales bacterium UPWRP_1]|nr:hypothetical protein B6N25_12885 [Sphingobacteriales bacterium TSM_CSS]PSJ76985.1 DUF1501 domain-containing protein [Sphingobacteriales bacterium UPWRP_1]